jgi:uncharacterized protein YceK
MHRLHLLALVLIVCLLTVGCSAVQSSVAGPPATPTTPPRATATTKPDGKPAAKSAVKPTAAAAPAASPARASTKPVESASPAAVAIKPAAKPSPSSVGASRPPAVIATSVAGLPAVGPTAGVSAEARAVAPADTLGVAASAGAAAAGVSDQEATTLCGPGAVLSTQAGHMAGKSATVAMTQVTAAYQPAVRGQPTFLYDAPAPNHVFSAVIWGSERSQFQPTLESWQGKGLCVTGPVELVEQRPQVVVTAPSQLRAAR